MLCSFRDPSNEVRIVATNFRARAACNYKGVDGAANFCNRSCIGEDDAAIRLKGSFKAGVRKLNLVTGRIRKDFQWPCHVQYLNGRRSDYDYFPHIVSVGELKRTQALRMHKHALMQLAPKLRVYSDQNLGAN